MTGCCLKIKEAIGGLTRKEKAIAEYVLEFADIVPEMSIEELAQSCGVSPSSVVRFCKSLDFSGYRSFCRQLMADVSGTRSDEVEYEDVRPGDSLSSIAKNVSLSNIKAIESSLQMTGEDALEVAVSALCRARRVDFYGVGPSGLVARDAHNKFLRIGKVCNACEDAHVQVLCAASLRRGDVAVFISYSGETQEILTIADIARRNGATVIAVTRYGKNPLAAKADICLTTYSDEGMLRSGAMSSRISQLTIIDVLYTAVASREYGSVKPSLDRSRFAVGMLRSGRK